MARFTFVTSNDHKILTAKTVCEPLGIPFRHKHMDFVEIQADGEAIALDKVRQAYDKFREPVVITDDSWLIHGLNGFPGPYMKYMNQWFGPDDFVRLTRDLDDRRMTMRQIIAYKDAGDEKLFVADIDGVLLKEPRGRSVIPHFAVVSFDGGKRSVAEEEDGGTLSAVATRPNAWYELCEWLAEQPAVS